MNGWGGRRVRGGTPLGDTGTQGHRDTGNEGSGFVNRFGSYRIIVEPVHLITSLPHLQAVCVCGDNQPVYACALSCTGGR